MISMSYGESKETGCLAGSGAKAIAVGNFVEWAVMEWPLLGREADKSLRVQR
jgi:hypothetical protein